MFNSDIFSGSPEDTLRETGFDYDANFKKMGVAVQLEELPTGWMAVAIHDTPDGTRIVVAVSAAAGAPSKEEALAACYDKAYAAWNKYLGNWSAALNTNPVPVTKKRPKRGRA